MSPWTSRPVKEEAVDDANTSKEKDNGIRFPLPKKETNPAYSPFFPVLCRIL
jgi:hypothetical protein